MRAFLFVREFTNAMRFPVCCIIVAELRVLEWWRSFTPLNANLALSYMHIEFDEILYLWVALELHQRSANCVSSLHFRRCV